MSWEDAQELLQFTEAILEHVVVYRERFERFKVRRTESRRTSEIDPKVRLEGGER
jgi:hypothetical protein